MYNRYIPQSDGSYRRNRVPEPSRPPKPEAPPPKRPAESPHREAACPKERPAESPHREAACPKERPAESPRRETACPKERPHREPPKQSDKDASVLGFLRRLLPKNFDTGDLLIVLLLLLVAGDNAEDSGNALLTLALYLFM